MEKLTKQQAVEEHRKMWRWIAEQTEKQQRYITKVDYLEQLEIPKSEYPHSNCFCCEYGKNTRISLGYCDNAENTCKFCPIDWDSTEIEFMCQNKDSTHDNLYYSWVKCKIDEDLQQAAKLAKQIAELPERK